MKRSGRVRLAVIITAVIAIVCAVSIYRRISGSQRTGEAVASSAADVNAGGGTLGTESASVLTWKIGVMSSMEGDGAAAGLAAMSGMQLAVDELNTGGEVLVELNWKYTGEEEEPEVELWEWGAAAILYVGADPDTEDPTGSEAEASEDPDTETLDTEAPDTEAPDLETFRLKYEERYGIQPESSATAGYRCILALAEALALGEEAAWEAFCQEDFGAITILTQDG